MIDITQVEYAESGTAWKTASMRGYVFKTALDADKYGSDAYSLTFREAADDESGTTPVPKDHVFYFNIDAAKAAVNPSDAHTAAQHVSDLLLDNRLFELMLKYEWLVGSQEDFEEARGGGGKW